jgi:undecaprenyl-diphosphatase
MDTLLTKRNTILIVFVLALWRMYLSATLQLHPDEAYYWLYSRRLDLGYYDHAPLVGYLIRLTTLFSSQELWVRFGGILETVVVSVISWILSIQLFDNRKIASAGVITLNVLPLTLAGSIIMTPDNPLFLFVGLTTYFCWQIVATQKVRYWYLLGIAFGLSLLSKYTGVLIAPSLFLFILATDERRWLKTIHPYAAFLLGCAFFLPVVYWNSKHQWMSFAFQMRHGLGGDTYTLGHVLTYIGGQMAVASPLLWLAGAYASILYLFQKDKRKLFLSLTFLPTILFFTYSSLKRPAAANWPCTAYVVFGILVSHYLLADGSRKKERLWIAAVLLSLTLSLIGGLHARFGIIPLEKISPAAAEADATQFFYGWRELARELEKDPSIKVVITDNHLIVEETDYYTQERIYADVNWRYPGPNQYGLWKIPGSVIGKDGVCIDVVGKNGPLPCRNYFTAVGADYTFPIIRDGMTIRTYHIVRGTGFKPPQEWLTVK